MLLGSFATFEAIKKRDTVLTVAVVDNKIVLNEEEQPHIGKFLSMSCGMAEKNSTPLENAQRELLEETGLVSEDWHEWQTTDPFKHPKIEWNNFMFIAKGCRKESDPVFDSGEKIITHYITFDEFLELRHNPKFRNKDLLPILEKAANSEEEKQKLQDLFGIKN
jgi:ADP-ribose pyrophosphatase YjhB (NUDIX family)